MSALPIRPDAGEQLPPGGPQAPPSDLPSPDSVAEVLRGILDGPEFPVAGSSPWEELGRWFREAMEYVWAWFKELLGPGGTGLGTVVTVAAALAACIVIGMIAARHAPRLSARGQNGQPEEADAPATAGDWLRAASRRHRRGELRPAASALYRGFLLTLEQKGDISFHASKTPGDYAAEVEGGGRAEDRRAGRAPQHFLKLFQNYSFGPEAPTSAGYAELAMLARDAGCPVAEETSPPTETVEEPD